MWKKFHEWLVGGNFTFCLWQNFYGEKTTQSWMKQPLRQLLLVNSLSCYTVTVYGTLLMLTLLGIQVNVLYSHFLHRTSFPRKICALRANWALSRVVTIIVTVHGSRITVWPLRQFGWWWDYITYDGKITENLRLQNIWHSSPPTPGHSIPQRELEMRGASQTSFCERSCMGWVGRAYDINCEFSGM